jgi:hypothetical protein
MKNADIPEDGIQRYQCYKTVRNKMSLQLQLFLKAIRVGLFIGQNDNINTDEMFLNWVYILLKYFIEKGIGHL